MAKLEAPSVKNLYDAFIADYESRTGQSTPLLQSAFIRALAWPFAGLTVLCYHYGQNVYLQMFLESCSAESLTLYGNRVGLTRKDGTNCIATLTLNGVTASSIASGTTFISSKGALYKTTDATPIYSGVALCVITSVLSGSTYNVDISEELSLSSPLIGVPPTGTITGVTAEGVEPEGVEVYRARVQSRYQLAPQGGAPADYLLWGTEVEGVANVLPYVYNPGLVTLYVVSAGSGADRVPSFSMQADVESSVRQSPNSTVFDRQPIQSDLEVRPVIIENFQVAITGLDASANTADNRTALKEAIRVYLETLKPQIPALGYSANGATVSNATATATATVYLSSSPNAGVFESLEISLDGVPLTTGKYKLPTGTIAGLESLSINGAIVV